MFHESGHNQISFQTIASPCCNTMTPSVSNNATDNYINGAARSIDEPIHPRVLKIGYVDSNWLYNRIQGQGGYILIDARDRATFYRSAKGHIAGAINIPLDINFSDGRKRRNCDPLARTLNDRKNHRDLSCTQLQKVHKHTAKKTKNGIRKQKRLSEHSEGDDECQNYCEMELALDDILFSFFDEESHSVFEKRGLLDIIVYDNFDSSTFLKEACQVPSSFIRRTGLPLCEYLRREGIASGVKYLVDTFDEFHRRYPFMTEKQETILGRSLQRRTRYPNEILDNFLYMGNADQAKDENILADLGITHVINVGSEKDHSTSDQVKYCFLPLLDRKDADLFPVLDDFVDSVEQARAIPHSKIFIHCTLGISRSAAALLYYFMKVKHWSLTQAYNYSLSRRPLIYPNEGFIYQLIEKEKELLGTSSVNNEDIDLLLQGYLTPTRKSGSSGLAKQDKNAMCVIC